MKLGEIFMNAFENMILGMGLAAAAGAAAAMALSSHQKPIKKAAEKAAKNMGEAVEQFTQHLSM